MLAVDYLTTAQTQPYSDSRGSLGGTNINLSIDTNSAAIPVGIDRTDTEHFVTVGQFCIKLVRISGRALELTMLATSKHLPGFRQTFRRLLLMVVLILPHSLTLRPEWVIVHCMPARERGH